MAKVFFNYADRNPSMANRTAIKQLVEDLFQIENIKVKRVDYIFCSDYYLLNINRQFLAHDFYTDVITFRLSKKKEEIKGEIYISVDRVKENAANLNLTYKEELLRVMFHGALHLCGYTDKAVSSKRIMREKENFYLAMFHVKR